MNILAIEDGADGVNNRIGLPLYLKYVILNNETSVFMSIVIVATVIGGNRHRLETIFCDEIIK